MQKYTIAVLVKNEAGVLNRVTSMFRRRQFNINSLTVSETESDEYSRITVTYDGEPELNSQIVNQLYKLNDVCKVKEHDSDDSVNCELMLIKIKNEPETRDEIKTAAEAYKAEIVDYTRDSVIMRIAGSSKRIDAFIALMKEYKILEICRTGVAQCRYIYDFPGGNRHLPNGAFDKDVFLEGKGMKKVFFEMMTGINMNHVCMKLIKTPLVKGLSFDTTLPTAEDLDFCVKIFANAKSYYFTTKVMYHYCRWENSLTGKGLPFKVRLDANRQVSRLIAKTLPAWGIDTPFYRLLAFARPYTIIASKIVRILREKLNRKDM